MNRCLKMFALAIPLCGVTPSSASTFSGGLSGGVGAHNGVGVEDLAYFGGVAGVHLRLETAKRWSVRANLTWMIFPETEPGYDTGPLPPGFGTDAGQTGAAQLVSMTLGAQGAIAGLNNGYFVAGPGVYYALEFPGYSGTRLGVMGGVGVGLKTDGAFKLYFEGQLNVVDWPGGPMVLIPIQLYVSF